MNIKSMVTGWQTSSYRSALMTLILLAAHAVIASAEDACCGEAKILPGRIGCGVGSVPLCCPDDYDRKPVPCVFPVSNCCPDTYCPKPCLVLPCPEKTCCPDDYCRKPLPSACRPAVNPWYKCVPLAASPWRRAACTGDRTD